MGDLCGFAAALGGCAGGDDLWAAGGGGLHAPVGFVFGGRGRGAAGRVMGEARGGVAVCVEGFAVWLGVRVGDLGFPGCSLFGVFAVGFAVGAAHFC